jgi:ribosomal protein S18 acetylase RimI-like enzyme
MIIEVNLDNRMELAQLRQLHRDSQVYQHIHLDGKADNDEFRDSVNRSLSDNLLNDFAVFLIGVNNGSIYGYVQLRLPDKRYEAWVDDLYIDPKYRHQGKAKELLAAAEKLLINRVAKVIRLYTQVDNHGARATYDCCGYNQVKIEDGYVDYEKAIT